jgi:TonB family protein
MMKKYSVFVFSGFISVLLHFLSFSLFKVVFIKNNQVLPIETKISYMDEQLVKNMYGQKDLTMQVKDVFQQGQSLFEEVFFYNNKIENKYLLKKFLPDKKQKEAGQVDVDVQSQRQILRLYYPIYPAWAKKMRLEAEIKVRIKIATNGQVEEVMFDKMSEYPELDMLGISAIKKWKFQPAFATSEDEQWGTATLKFNVG